MSRTCSTLVLAELPWAAQSLAVAIAVFLLTKRHAERGLRRDFARILLTEIGTIMLQVRPKIFGASTGDLYYVGAYDGLHKSGNIRYMPAGLHRELARLYGQYERGGPWAVDMGAAVDICARLEGAMRDNSGYREKIRSLGRRRGTPMRTTSACPARLSNTPSLRHVREARTPRRGRFRTSWPRPRRAAHAAAWRSLPPESLRTKLESAQRTFPVVTNDPCLQASLGAAGGPLGWTWRQANKFTRPQPRREGEGGRTGRAIGHPAGAGYGGIAPAAWLAADTGPIKEAGGARRESGPRPPPAQWKRLRRRGAIKTSS